MIALKKSFLFDLLLFIIVSFFANGLYYMFFYASSSWIENSIISTIGISTSYIISYFLIDNKKGVKRDIFIDLVIILSVFLFIRFNELNYLYECFVIRMGLYIILCNFFRRLSKIF